ncbi:MAG: hypothetical protein ABGX25_05450 [Nautiliaceae bacterium]
MFEAREKTKKLFDDMKALCKILNLNFLDEVETLIENWKKRAIRKIKGSENE